MNSVIMQKRKIKGLKPEYYDKRSLLFNKGILIDENEREFIIPHLTPINLIRDLDSGTLCDNTWYYVWICRKKYNKIAKLIFSVSFTNPLLPRGYIHCSLLPIAVRYVGEIKNNTVFGNGYRKEILPFMIGVWKNGKSEIRFLPDIRHIPVTIKCSDVIK